MTYLTKLCKWTAEQGLGEIVRRQTKLLRTTTDRKERKKCSLAIRFHNIPKQNRPLKKDRGYMSKHCEKQTTKLRK